jgi:hypothetical protein
MPHAIAIHGHDIIDLVATHPAGIRLSQLPCQCGIVR